MASRKDDRVSLAPTIAISSGTMFRILIIAAAVVFLYLIRDIVAMTLIAILLAALIDPFADGVAKWKIPRSLAVLAVYFVSIALLTVAAVLIVPPMFAEVSELTTALVPFFADANGVVQVQTILQDTWSTNVRDVLLAIRDSGFAGAFPKIAEFGTSAVDVVFRAIIVLILAFYFVVEKDSMVRGIGLIAPPEYQPFVNRMALKARERMGVWLRGQLLLMVSIFVLTYIILSILGIPYALVLALFAGLMEFIPFIGPILSAVPAIFLAFAVSPLHALLTALAYLVVQQVEGNILVPKIMQRVAGVNPVVSVLAVLIGWRVGGTVGAIISIPLSMTIAVFLSEVFRERESV